jgi:tetratricopeptide (TPR) repeat protein
MPQRSRILALLFIVVVLLFATQDANAQSAAYSRIDSLCQRIEELVDRGEVTTGFALVKQLDVTLLKHDAARLVTFAAGDVAKRAPLHSEIKAVSSKYFLSLSDQLPRPDVLLLALKTAVLEQIDSNRAAIATCDTLYEELTMSPAVSRGDSEIVVRTIICQAIAYEALGDQRAAIATYDRTIQFAHALAPLKDTTAMKMVTLAYTQAGTALLQSEPQRAIAYFDGAIALYHAHPNLSRNAQLAARAYASKGYASLMLTDSTGASTAWGTADSLLGSSTDPIVNNTIAAVLAEEARLWMQRGNNAEVERKLLLLYKKLPDVQLGKDYWILTLQGLIHTHLARRGNVSADSVVVLSTLAIKYIDEFIIRFESDSDPMIQEQVAELKHNKALLLKSPNAIVR